MSKHPLTKVLALFLGQVNTISVPRPILAMLDNDHALAIMLSQGAYWSVYSPLADEDGWFPMSPDQWQQECGVSAKQLRRGRDALAKYGFQWRRVGFPAQVYYRVDTEIFANAVSQLADTPVERAGVEGQKGRSGGPKGQDCTLYSKKKDTDKETNNLMSGTAKTEDEKPDIPTPALDPLGDGQGDQINQTGKASKDVPPAPAAEKPDKDAAIKPFIDAWNTYRFRLPAVRWPVSEARKSAVKAFIALCEKQGMTASEALARWSGAVQEVATNQHYIENGYGLDNMARHVEKHADAWEAKQRRAIRTPETRRKYTDD